MAQFSDVQHGKKHWHSKPEQEDRGSYIPSPAEIRRQCLLIQRRWSDYERNERNQHQTEPVTVARAFRSNLGKQGAHRRHFSVERQS